MKKILLFMKKVLLFMFGIIMGIVLTVGGIGYGAYYVATEYTIEKVENDFGVQIPVAANDNPDNIRDKSLVEIIKLVQTYAAAPDSVTVDHVRTAFGLENILTNDLIGIDMSNVYALPLSGIKNDGVNAVVNSFSLGTVIDLAGMDTTSLAFLEELREEPVMTAFNSIQDLPLGVIAGIEPDAEPIVTSILYPEDSTGSYVKWTAPEPSNKEYFVNVEDFNVTDDTIKYIKTGDNEYKKVTQKNESESGERYVKIRNEYITTNYAAECYSTLSSAKKYKAMSLSGGLNVDMNGVYLADVISADGSNLLNSLLYAEYDESTDAGKTLYKKDSSAESGYSEAESGYEGTTFVKVSIGDLTGDFFNDVMNTITIADVMDVTGGEDSILASIAFTKVETPIDGEKYYGIINGTYDGKEYNGRFMPIDEIEKITGEIYADSRFEAISVGDLETKVNALTLSDILPKPAEDANAFYIKLYDSNRKITEIDSAFIEELIDGLYVSDIMTIDGNTEKILTALAFSKCDATDCEKEHYGILNGEFGGKNYNNEYVKVSKIEKLKGEPYTGDRYHPTSVNSLQEQINLIKLCDILPEPDAESSAVYVKLYESNQSINNLNNAFFSDLVDSLTIGDFITVTKTDSKVLQSLAFTECTHGGTCTEEHYGILNGEFGGKIYNNEYMKVSKIEKLTSNPYDGKKYHGTSIDGLSNKINTLKLCDILNEPEDNSHALYRKLYDSDTSITGIDSAFITGLVNDLNLSDVITVTEASSKILQSLAFSKCDATNCEKEHYGIADDGSYKPISQLQGYDGTKYHATSINDMSGKIDTLKLCDILNEPEVNSHALYRKLYESNTTITGIDSAFITGLVDDLNLSDVITVTETSSKILQSLAFTECTPGEPCTEEHYRIADDGSYKPIPQGYSGTMYHATQISELSTKITSLTLGDVLGEPEYNLNGDPTGIFALVEPTTLLTKLNDKLTTALDAETLTIKKLEQITGKNLTDTEEIEDKTISQILTVLNDNWSYISTLFPPST